MAEINQKLSNMAWDEYRYESEEASNMRVPHAVYGETEADGIKIETMHWEKTALPFRKGPRDTFRILRASTSEVLYDHGKEGTASVIEKRMMEVLNEQHEVDAPIAEAANG